MTHPADDAGIDILAAISDLSPKHFARAFGKSTGMPPHRWLIERRTDRARALFRTPHLSLAEIALACGFGDQSRFTAAFRKAAVLTTGGYRREILI